MIKIAEVKKHAKFSASGSARWLSCPGSLVLSESAPDAQESKYAKEGTDAHECLEFLLKNHNQLAAVVNTAKKKYPLEMVEYAIDAVMYITDLLEAHEGSELLCETEVRLDFIEPGMFGTLDAAVVRHFHRLTVIDYKYGAGLAVDPEYNGDLNSQLAYYALGISHSFDHNFAEIELVIIQPRAFHESGETIRSAIFTIDQLLAWEQKFRDGVERCKNSYNQIAPVCRSGSWCRFCPAAVICPELKNESMRQAQIVFSDDAGLVSVPEPKMIVLPDLGPALDACEKLEAWIDKVREHALHVLDKGHDIPGWKLVQKRGIRKWINEDEIKVKFGQAALAAPKVLSPAQFEKKNPNQDIDKFVTSQSSGTTIARESDKRPAIKPMSAIFGELT